MQQILLGLGQALRQKIFVLGLMVLITLSGLFVFVQNPSYAVTRSSDKLTPDEKIERAYDQSEAAGLLEQAKQESANRDELFNPNVKANIETAKDSEEASEGSLKEKAKELLEKISGKQ